MFAVAPEGFGNSGYHQFGERDVLEVIERVVERYRIDPKRIYITGPSMGGIGAGGIPLRNPDLFAAAAPLCGYHSLANYSSLKGVEWRPWERFLASFRSNADWAMNGRHLPMYVVHGTRDNPRHSASLVERYRLLGYDVTYETPDAGHNVWDETYQHRRIFTHFKPLWRRPNPRRVTLRTARLRYNRASWLRIDDALDYGAWSEIDGARREQGRVEITTENVRAFTVTLDEKLTGGGALELVIDGDEVEPATDEGDGLAFHRSGDGWVGGAPEPCPGICKRPGLAGPMDDVYYEPLLFVYGTADPDETAVSRRVVEAIRRPRGGVTVDWPVEADVEVSAEDIASHSLVIVGTPRGNSLLGRIADRLPLRVDRGAVVAGGERFEGDRVAASFVCPNPLNPDRYVLVHTAVSWRGLFYTGHLPTLLPDWVVYDGSSWGRVGGTVFNERRILAGGLFDRNWRIAD
jgi:predicted esterase